MITELENTALKTESRLTKLETVLPRVEYKVDIIDAKLQVLIDAHNNQRGVAKVAGILMTGLGMVGSAFLDHKFFKA